jgi:YidC/Oxa1 family membrane protein insertase
LSKRLPLAFFLALLVMAGWQLLFPPPAAPARPTAPAGPAAEAPASEAALAPTPAPPAEPSVGESEEREIELRVGPAGPTDGPARPGTYRARFSNRGAALLELDLRDYVRTVGLDAAQRDDPANWLPLVESIRVGERRTGSLVLRTSASSRGLTPVGLDEVLWEMEELSAPDVGVRFRHSPADGSVLLEKTVRFVPDTWDLSVTLTIENRSAGAARGQEFLFTPAGCVMPELGDRFYAEPQAIAIGRPRGGGYELDSRGAPKAKGDKPLEVPVPLVVAGMMNKYFAFLMREADEAGATMGGANTRPLVEAGGARRETLEVDVPLSLALPEPGSKRSWEYLVYAGPKDPDTFVGDFAPHQQVIDHDLSVDSVAKALLFVLRQFHGLFGNWGVAIIVLTLCVRLALFPLNRRSQTAMARYQKKMKRVQPRIDEAKKQFAKDPQKLREAQARIMQEEGAFPPLGGCLPVFLQMPIFFGLFSALRTSFDLRQAPFFGYIQDLSRPDRLLHVGLELPLLPDIEYFNLLPILMVVLWVLQQMGMPKPADEQAARMQKMMMFMPVVFGLMLYNYAAGLSLYMMTTSSLSIVEQKLIRKVWPIDDTEVDSKKPGGCGPFSGVMRNLAEKHQEQLKRMQAMEAERRRQQGRKKR